MRGIPVTIKELRSKNSSAPSATSVKCATAALVPAALLSCDGNRAAPRTAACSAERGAAGDATCVHIAAVPRGASASASASALKVQGGPERYVAKACPYSVEFPSA